MCFICDQNISRNFLASVKDGSLEPYLKKEEVKKSESSQEEVKKEEVKKSERSQEEVKTEEVKDEL